MEKSGILIVCLLFASALASAEARINPLQMVASMGEANQEMELSVAIEKAVDEVAAQNGPLKCAQLLEDCFRTPCCSYYLCSTYDRAICILPYNQI